MKKAPCERCIVNPMCREPCYKYFNYVERVFSSFKMRTSPHRIAFYIKRSIQKGFQCNFKVGNYHAGLFEISNSSIKFVKAYRCRPNKGKDRYYESSVTV